QNALLAGLSIAKTRCDAAISLDADLQDDINAIDQMIDKFKNGCDVVYGVRNKRTTDSFFKRTTAQGFYKIMKVLGVNVIYNHADYRLMSKRALEALENFEEVNMFLRGIVPLIGYKSDIVYYERNERFAGESKYPLKKMLSFAIEGITSFSIKPIRMVTWIGFIIFFISLIMLIYTLFVNIFGSTEPGWSSIVASIWMIGGIQLLCLGVVGEYIGKIYKETKKRPNFIIETFLSNETNN
ncbi:MAG: glycosyltransferase, partial [Clostridia bacterium]